jgi:serpin B
MIDPGDTVDHLQKLAAHINGFGHSVFCNLMSTNKGKRNLVMSPYAAAQAMVVVACGAQGDTVREMRKALDITYFGSIVVLAELYKHTNAFVLKVARSEEDLDKSQVAGANSAWVQPSVEVVADWKKLVEEQFGAEVRVCIDGEEFRRWCQEKTHGQITSLPNCDFDCGIVVTSVASLRCAFVHGFDPSLTRPSSFEAPEGTINVEMMYQEREFSYCEATGFQEISLELAMPTGLPVAGPPLIYGKQRSLFDVTPSLVLTIVLPSVGSDVQALFGERSREWKECVGKLNRCRGKLYLPKFRVGYGQDIQPQLQNIGIKEAFTPDADFGKAVRVPGRRKNEPSGVFLRAVVHSTFIDVTEHGAGGPLPAPPDAAPSSVSDLEFTMKVDRPFLFFVHERNTRAILFCGKIDHPTVNKAAI